MTAHYNGKLRVAQATEIDELKNGIRLNQISTLQRAEDISMEVTFKISFQPNQNVQMYFFLKSSMKELLSNE
jgi:hypothetical protein